MIIYVYTTVKTMFNVATPDCKLTQMGKKYNGTHSTTISGKVCQRWDSSVPHNHGITDPRWFPDNSLSDAANYCRNPSDWAEGPFCITTDPKVEWEVCDIPFCKGNKTCML